MRALTWARWVAETLSLGKSFRDNPILGSARLNQAGLHTARIRLAHAAARARRAQLAWRAPAAWRDAFERDGFVVIEGFAATGLFQRARDEARSIGGELREGTQGDTLTHRALLDRAARRRMPALATLADDARLRGLLSWAAGTAAPPLFYVQQVLNRVRDAPPDPQKLLHSDTFHPTVKAWLFFDEVHEDAGPFRYVPGSHRPSPARLAWERARSLDAITRDSYSARGSLRLTEQERVALGYPEARAFAVPPNTLVIADTHGFHARGHSREPSSRLELFAYSRPLPFAPLVLPPVPFAADAQDALLRAWWARQDARFAARGRPSPWHVVHRDSLDAAPYVEEP